MKYSTQQTKVRKSHAFTRNNLLLTLAHPRTTLVSILILLLACVVSFAVDAGAAEAAFSINGEPFSAVQPGATQAETWIAGEAVSPEGLLNPDGTLNLSTGFQGTLDLSGWQVTLDSQLGPVFSATAQADANWQPAWQTLPPQGLNGNVNAIAVVDTRVYVGGAFTASQDGTITNLNHIAVFSGDYWFTLPNQGLNGNVNALLLVGTDLYVGGNFSQTGDGTLTGLGNLARYNTNLVNWYALPRQGVNGGVWALAKSGDNLFVGGAFSQTGDGAVTNLGNLARYNLYNNTWNALPKHGLNNAVMALAISDTDLYAGGQFTATGDGTLTNLGYIALYDISSADWISLPGNGLNNWVLALVAVGNDVYAGGVFNKTGDNVLTAYHLARFDTISGEWNALPGQGLDNYVYALAVSDGDLYVGGAFGQTADAAIRDLDHIARYDVDNSSWGRLPDQGLNGNVSALAVGVHDLYVGGQFTATSGGALTNLGQIARVITTPAALTALPDEGLNNDVYSLAVLGSDLYVGGNFSASGDGGLTNLGQIARYDTIGRTWHALSNSGLNASVDALIAVGNDLYVGGSFTQTGDGSLTNLGRIARYDTLTGTWYKLPKNGLNGTVVALAQGGDAIFVGGMFSQSGDGTLTNLGNIVRYDIPSNTWQALANAGLDNAVFALVSDGGYGLYVGGQFDATGDGAETNLGKIAAYDIYSDIWYGTLNQGFNGAVNALAIAGTGVYVGGGFNQTGDGNVTYLGNIARIDTVSGATSALPRQGLNGGVNALAVAGDKLYVGGMFSQTYDGTLTQLGNSALYNVRTGAWQKQSHQGLSGGVYALAAGSGGVYQGGNFEVVLDGSLASLGYIIHYGVNAWQPLSNQGLPNGVEALAVAGSNLFVGGSFTETGDGALGNLGYIAGYDTIQGIWFPLPNQGLDGSVRALAVAGNNLYVGGGFTQTGDGTLTNLGYIARFDLTTGTWQALSRQGLEDYVYDLAISGDNLFVGGSFETSGDGSLINLGYIARYNIPGNTWHALARQGLDDFVYAVAVNGNDLYAGGYFTQTGDGALKNLGSIARYNLSAGTWHALSRQGLDSTVYALAFAGDNLFVGGSFDATGDDSLRDLGSIARYNTATSTWYALSNQGLSGRYSEVTALVVVNSNLYVGGDINETEDSSVNNLNGIARYNLSTGTWHALPNQGLNNKVYALAVLGDDLYVGGVFDNSDDETLLDLGGIARIEVGFPYQIFLPLATR